MPVKPPPQPRSKPVISAAVKATPVDHQPPQGWLRSTREALGESQTKVAGKLGIRRQAYANFETGEVRSTISLASLRRAAHAMDCDLVYSFVSRTKVAPAKSPARATPTQRDSVPPARRSAAEQFIAQPERADGDLPVQLL